MLFLIWSFSVRLGLIINLDQWLGKYGTESASTVVELVEGKFPIYTARDGSVTHFGAISEYRGV